MALPWVGDDAQSIYSFRAATIRNILDFPASFSPAADIITLDRNYRSTQPILAAANGVIDWRGSAIPRTCGPPAIAGATKLVTVRDETEQANFIVDQVLANRETGMTLKQQAVLFSHVPATAVRLKSSSPAATFLSSKFGA